MKYVNRNVTKIVHLTFFNGILKFDVLQLQKLKENTISNKSSLSLLHFNSFWTFVLTVIRFCFFLFNVFFITISKTSQPGQIKFFTLIIYKTRKLHIQVIFRQSPNGCFFLNNVNVILYVGHTGPLWLIWKTIRLKKNFQQLT